MHKQRREFWLFFRNRS